MPAKHSLYIATDSVTLSSESEGGEYGDWSETNQFSVTGARIATNEGGSLGDELVEVDFDPSIIRTVFVVWAEYSTGNTFGHSSGNGQIVAAFDTAEKAQALEKSIRNNTYEGRAEWKGYFESLEDVHIKVLTIG